MRNPRVAVVDSGIAFDVAGGVNLCGGAEFSDQLGHGTVVAAAILAQAPEIELFSVKVFGDALDAPASRVAEAITWCAANGMDFVNLSLGSEDEFPIHAPKDMVIVAPAHCFPGRSGGVIAVRAAIFHQGPPKQVEAGLFRASPYPPPLPGLPAARNAMGVSFAVANVTAHLIRTASQE
ncbi:MAG: S8 family serine peptidase [Bryobacterales bacterium]|nr:S8 family serine peptidase [Bryobacterales bacterium]